MDSYWGIAIGVIGLLLGLFFALNGFSAPAKSEDLKNTARVRNLMWLVTGAVGVVLADWKKLVFGPPDAGFLLISYLLGAITGTILGLLGIVAFIAFDLARTNSGRTDHGKLPRSLITDYLHYGYAYYVQRRAEAAQQADNGVLMLTAQERLVRLQRDARIQDVIAALVHAIASVFTETDPTRRKERQKEVIEPVLAGIVAAVTNHARSGAQDLKLRANYMIVVPIGSATADQKGAALFRFGDENRYTSLLVLEQQTEGIPGETVVLPVDGLVANRDMLLPGAPETFVLRKAAVINCNNVKFRRGIDQKTQTAIQKFFKDVDYASVASIPISGKDGPKGVINIESNRNDLLGEGEEIGKAVCGTLQPFAALLSRLI